MSSESLTERVTRRIVALYKDGRFKQNRIAEDLGVHPSSVNAYMHGQTPMSLDFLEAVTEATGERIAELVAPEGAVVKQLNADEAFVLRSLRLWPAPVTRALVTFLTFFADEKPVDVQTRNLHAYWRGMKQTDRDWFYGIAQMAREGMLSPDIRAGLVDRLEAERPSAATHDARTRPKGKA